MKPQDAKRRPGVFSYVITGLYIDYSLESAASSATTVTSLCS